MGYIQYSSKIPTLLKFNNFATATTFYVVLWTKLKNTFFTAVEKRDVLKSKPALSASLKEQFYNASTNPFKKYIYKAFEKHCNKVFPSSTARKLYLHVQ